MHLYKKEILCQANQNKMALTPIPDDLKVLEKPGKFLISKRILFKKIAAMQSEFS